MHCVVVCCRVLQSAAVCYTGFKVLAVCCSVLQCVAARNNVLQPECVATLCIVLHRVLRIACGHKDQFIDPLLSAVCCSVLRCVL